MKSSAAYSVIALSCLTVVDAAPRIDDDVPIATAVVDRDYIAQNSGALTASAIVRASNERVQRDTEALIPIKFSDDGNSVVFANVVHNLRDGGEHSFSGGLGARFYLPAHNSVFGFYVSGDSTETLKDNEISQLGFGFDLFTPSGIDFHGNIYLPESDEYVTDQFTEYGDMFASGFTIFQTQNLLSIFERGRKGADIKVKFDVPVANEIIPTRGHVGAYHFDSAYGNDLSGMTAGITLQPFRHAAFGAEYYGDEEFFGDHWVFFAGVSAPVDFSNLLKPAELVRGIGRAFRIDTGGRDRSEAGMRSLMTNRIDRRNWVLQEWSAPRVTGTNDVVIEDDIIFVNNGLTGAPNGSANGRGTFEDPVNTIGRGVQRSANKFGNRGTVLVAGTEKPYVEEVFDSGRGFHLRSGHIPYRGFNGEKFTYGARPLLNGGVIVDEVPNFTLTGFRIAGGAMSLTNPDTVFIENVSKVLVTRNTIESSAQDGIDIEASGGSVVNATLTRNRVFNTDDEAFDFDVGDNATLNLTAINNLANMTGGNGVGIDVDENSRLNLSWTGGSISNTAFDGFAIDAEENSVVDATITDLEIANVEGDGIFLDSDDENRSTLRVIGGSITGAGIDGVSIEAEDETMVAALVDGTKISDTTFDGVYLNAFDDTIVSLDVRNATISDIPFFGIGLEIAELANVEISLTDNTISETGAPGIRGEMFGGSNLTGIISGNTITSDLGGIELLQRIQSTTRLRILDNTISSPAVSPLALVTFGNAAGDFQVANNSFSSGAGDPVRIVSRGNSTLDLQFFGNTSDTNVNLREIIGSGSVYTVEDTLGTNSFTNGATFNNTPNLDFVPFGTFGFPNL